MFWVDDIFIVKKINMNKGEVNASPFVLCNSYNFSISLKI